MRRSTCFFLGLLFLCGGSAPLFAATDHSAHGIDSSAFHLTLEAEPEVIQAGQQVEIALRLTDAYGAPVSEFEIVHEKKLHLIIVREGLDKFTHTHPEPGPDGTMRTAMTFPEGGTYYFYADFTPRDGNGVTLMAELRVEGEASPAPPLDPYVPGMVQTDEMLAKVGIDAGQGMHRVSFALMDLNETPVTDLEPYLGAMGHFVVISADGSKYVHAHPLTTDKPNEVAFDVHFPGPGIYKGWGEFQRGGAVLLVPVVMQID
ncbi:hypothetical protein NLA06_10465 [Desulfomicrobium sp. ZS1]|uniref:hypothetical protein n=1 Tax=Desulfomicrobium sp. ZS1 TaxID=2952228 RepID=UPI0020B3B6AA|nr:hypothetical protein [Desulfomicrobium sp. ZS1]UTF48999.1 hypothetical protein NLA06_10465 [Desulfomicrobium sp. ZS1]